MNKRVLGIQGASPPVGGQPFGERVPADFSCSAHTVGCLFLFGWALSLIDELICLNIP